MTDTLVINSNPRASEPKLGQVARIVIVNPQQLSLRSGKEREETLDTYRRDARAIYNLWQYTLPSGTYQYLAQLMARDVDLEFLDGNPTLKLDGGQCYRCGKSLATDEAPC